jgi:RND family efflux transporter MFP subunit
MADLADAMARVKVDEAEAKKADVLVDFSKIRARYPGVITQRTLDRGGYVRSAKEGGTVLLTLARTDTVKVQVQIPDRDVPFANKGDPATVVIDNLGGKVFTGTISRTQGAEDPVTRTMTVEIDLDNPRGVLRPGMFGRVDIVLQKSASALTIPSGCLFGAAREGRGAVYIVKGGKAVLVPVRIGIENGVIAEIVSGLSPTDVVVRRYSGTLTNGSPVEVVSGSSSGHTASLPH